MSSQHNHSDSTNKTASTLDAVKLDFLNWRSEPNRPKNIPSYLWDKVFQILPHYKRGSLTRTLGISTRQLEKKMSERGQSAIMPNPLNLPQKPTIEPAFIQTIISAQITKENFFDVVLTKPNGATLTIQKLSHVDMLKLTEQFTG